MAPSSTVAFLQSISRPVNTATASVTASVTASISSVRSLIGKVIPTVLFTGGLALFSYGFWEIYHPLGYIIGGASLVWVATNVAAEREEADVPMKRRADGVQQK